MTEVPRTRSGALKYERHDNHFEDQNEKRASGGEEK